MAETEIETTYLAKALPENWQHNPSQLLVDIYFPANSQHPKLRIRQKGDSYTLTKKTLVNKGDASTQTEENVKLSAEEFEAIRSAKGKEVIKRRYNITVGEYVAELDVFEGDLKGLVLVDFEFSSTKDRDSFERPDWCGDDVTQEEFIAGGMLAGKTLADIQADLDRFGYQPL